MSGTFIVCREGSALEFYDAGSVPVFCNAQKTEAEEVTMEGRP